MRTKRVVTAAAVVGGTVLALAVVVTAVVALQSRHDYSSAPLCGGSPGPDCRTLEEATVTDIRPAAQPARILIDLQTDAGQRLTAQLSPNYRTSPMPEAGQRVEIEVWRGQVTQVQLPGRGLVRTYGSWT